MIRPIDYAVLILGKKCNSCCSFCSQSGNRGQVPENMEVAEACAEYLKYCAAEVYRVSGGQLKFKLLFWGGEPLLYFDRIKEVVSRLKDAPIQYGMTTNGLAFTGEMVDFFNKYNFLIALSNDGPLSARSRGNNCLEDPYIVACYKALTNPYKRITSVLTAHNQDIFALWNYLYAKVGFGFYNLARQVLRVLPETPADLVEFDYKAFTAAYERLIALANDYISGGPGESPDEHLRYNSYKFMITISGGLERRVHALPKWGLDCGQFTTRLALDLTGNIYLCQNRGEVLGHVSGETADLYANYFQTGNAPNKYPQCVDCKVFPICQGQCPCIPWTPLKEKVCALLNIMYGPALFTFQPLAGVGDRRD